ncbi:MAG: hypothetical protein IPL36_06695 [Nigerium sp.]|nr:hypothetical protein [Nigerium sp.]
MTALMIDGAIRPEVRTHGRRSRGSLGPVVADRPVVHWTRAEAQACRAGVAAAQAPGRPTLVAAGPTRLVWTPRGVAAMVLGVVMTAVFMLVTIVTAFLAVSNAPAPVGAMAPPAAVALAENGPGAGGRA